ncbi:MAG: AMP-binding protein [Caldilineaceae bacterium]
MLPSYQLAQHHALNTTSAPVPNQTLPQLFLQQVQEHPESLAIFASKMHLTYEKVYNYANQIGHWLRQNGAKPDQLVAVVMEKGWEQIVGVLGISLSGAAYLPVDPELPKERQVYLLENGNVQLILTQSHLECELLCNHNGKAARKLLSVDRLELMPELPLIEIINKPNDLAYVLYTSGSTGTPKGVMIEQQSVVNRMTDVAQQFHLTQEDRVLALTALHHDLSVFDLFAMLTIVGGG